MTDLLDPPPGGRRTDTRADTYEILKDSAGDGVSYLTNRDIQERLSLRNIDVTLPAVSARLRSLETMGSIKVEYSAQQGLLQRWITPVAPPKRPERPQRVTTHEP